MSDITHILVVHMIYEYYILGKILYKTERGGGGSSCLVRIQDSECTETFDLIPKTEIVFCANKNML